MITKYWLEKAVNEIPYYKAYGLMKEGAAVDNTTSDTWELIKAFDTAKEALREMDKYKTEVYKHNHYYEVIEYVVSEVCYASEEDCENGWADGAEILAVSEWTYSEEEESETD